MDIIPIGFINIFPPQANGLVAETFGNQCWNGNYTGPGYNGVKNPKNDFLYEQCPNLQRDIIYCQQKTNKKILLSLGGAVGNYQLNGAADGIYLAEFLWGAYGPYNPSWTGVRPLDRGYNNATAGDTVDFDGFDFDIEQSSPGNDDLDWSEISANPLQINKLVTLPVSSDFANSSQSTRPRTHVQKTTSSLELLNVLSMNHT